jgi:hypothetical protein
MCFRFVWLVALVAACSEYSFNEPSEIPDLTETTEDTVMPVCGTDARVDYTVEVNSDCAQEPVIGTFEPVLEWTWTDNAVHPGFHQVMATPVVANLTDDNADGAIDDNDVPDVVFTAFIDGNYRSPGALIALSGDDGSMLWSRTDIGGHLPMGAGGVAVGDLDGDGWPSVLVAASGGLLSVDPTGGLEWFAAAEVVADYGAPAIADLEGDGVAEVVFGRTVVESTGTVRWVGTGGTGGILFSSIPADLDGDGRMEVVAGDTVYAYDGSILWQDGGSDGTVAIADMDSDGLPEVVKVADSAVWLTDTDGTALWNFALTDGGGGPPTIADFDGDGLPEIGVASKAVYRVIDTDGTELWSNPVEDFSSSKTGSSVFDFEGDGAAEVVYADEETLWVFDGLTGAVELAWTDHSSGTIFEYPLVVDVDRDGAAEIVVASNDYSIHSDSRGITVIGDNTNSWAPARPVWNQHAYSISNVEDNGTVPVVPTPNWTQWNSFRAGNSQTAVGFDLPDLRAGDPVVCTDECWADRVLVWIPVENAGLLDVESIAVGLYALGGTETLVDLQGVSLLSSSEATWLGPLALSREDFGPEGLRVRVNDGSASTPLAECDVTNNVWTWERFPCPDL